jgi:hypothetical protein
MYPRVKTLLAALALATSVPARKLQADGEENRGTKKVEDEVDKSIAEEAEPEPLFSHIAEEAEQEEAKLDYDMCQSAPDPHCRCCHKTAQALFEFGKAPGFDDQIKTSPRHYVRASSLLLKKLPNNDVVCLDCASFLEGARKAAERGGISERKKQEVFRSRHFYHSYTSSIKTNKHNANKRAEMVQRQIRNWLGMSDKELQQLLEKHCLIDDWEGTRIFGQAHQRMNQETWQKQRVGEIFLKRKEEFTEVLHEFTMDLRRGVKQGCENVVLLELTL